VIIKEPLRGNNGEIKHYGILRKSGRYPWGSGENPRQRADDFFSQVDTLRKSGMSDSKIAKAFDMTTTDFRATMSIASNAKRRADEAMAMRLKEKGLSNTAIGERMGNINESTVRSLLDPSRQARADVLTATSNLLRKEVDEKKYLDIGLGNEVQLGISKEKMNTAVSILREEGYKFYNVDIEQVGQPGKYTKVKVLGRPDTDMKDLNSNRDQIKTLQGYSDDYGHTMKQVVAPRSISSKKLEIRYGPDGGSDMDGVIQLRPGVPELSLGTKRYAQVRIAVDGTHYLKGMAVYAMDLPDGVNIRFNTNKDATGNKLDALKSIKDDQDLPFGSVVRQRYYKDSRGKEQLSAINPVGTKEGSYEEGGWRTWTRALSSQMLSKQSPQLAKQQLALAYRQRKEDFDEIMSLTNPAVRKKLLAELSDKLDSDAVDLKAAPLPRQATKVLLPLKSLKDNEVYAPTFEHGETVVLIRHPHGGTFEIPELKVNNRNAEGRKIFGNMEDAVAINSKTAKRLSGADFDGDTVLVIPNNNHQVKTTAPLKALQKFDPIEAYPGYEGMKRLEGQHKQKQMGVVSNLITDMTIRKASAEEIAHAVMHSMVVIDAEKHGLNWKQSEIDNGIAALKKKYQTGGASTLISRASLEDRVPDRKLRKYAEGGPINPRTGEKVYTPTGASYVKTTVSKRGVVKETVIEKTVSSTQMAETKDARTLMSKPGTVMEAVYANHANELKALANQARKEYVRTPPVKYNPTANKVHAKEVASLQAKLNASLSNKPAERQATILARTEVNAKIKADPKLTTAQKKKIRTQALTKARIRAGAERTPIDITPSEWAAIQAGAISNNRLTDILAHTNTDVVRKYAMPRTEYTISDAKITRIKAMLARGYTQAEAARQLGVPASTLDDALARAGG